jgi:DNA-binding CsgD family transcriptional regulator
VAKGERGDDPPAANLGRLRRTIARVADPWAVGFAIVAALFGLAIGAHPFWWLAGAVAILVVHQLNVFASTAEEQDLTPRQLEIARQIAEGATDIKIAGDLGVPEREVEKEIRRILENLHRTNRSQIKRWYLRHHGEDVE